MSLPLAKIDWQMAETTLNLWRRTGRTASSPQPDFDSLFEQHWLRVFRVLLRIVDDPDQADELALDTFWALHDHLDTLPPEAVGGWLYRVATHNGLNALRARQRRAHYESHSEGAVAQNDHNPAVEVERADDRATVRAILLQMKQRDARLLFLRYAGFSYAELAEVVEVAAGSVGTLLARAEREFERRYRAMMSVEGGDE